MPITLYDAFVPSARQVLGAVRALVDKAETHCREKGCSDEEITAASLHETMLPFTFQVKSVAQHSHGAIEGARAGVFTPLGGETPADFAGIKAMLDKAEAGLQALDAAELESMIGKPMLFKMRDLELPFTVENFLLSFSQPNFYFHAATAYGIMRARGVALGKRDFLGHLRMTAAT
ncbi:MAG: DUF1993 domain-containing protein [Sandarakinorhabdus sp.]|nr:DUF1993 domain-containing protein [Sandarakinorhabdus sp.]